MAQVIYGALNLERDSEPSTGKISYRHFGPYAQGLLGYQIYPCCNRHFKSLSVVIAHLPWVQCLRLTRHRHIASEKRKPPPPPSLERWCSRYAGCRLRVAKVEQQARRAHSGKRSKNLKLLSREHPRTELSNIPSRHYNIKTVGFNETRSSENYCAV